MMCRACFLLVLFVFWWLSYVDGGQLYAVCYFALGGWWVCCSVCCVV